MTAKKLPPLSPGRSVRAMRRVALALACLAISPRAYADDEGAPPEPAPIEGEDVVRGTEKGTIGVGIIIGEPTGISARLYLQDDQAIQAAAGFAFLGGGLHVHADYVFHPVVFQTRDSFVLAGYVGPGARLIQYRDGRERRSFALGARGVAGLLFDFTVPLDAFVEVGGVLEYDFADEGGGLDVKLNVGAGVRYYF